jgi:hypothetical protein
MAEDNRQDRAVAWARIVARAWREPGFKSKLMGDPLTMLNAAGAALPAGVTVTVVEDAATLVHDVLPAKPVGLLSDEALERAAGGTCVDVADPHPVRNR